jgi:hypothetical protein
MRVIETAQREEAFPEVGISEVHSFWSDVLVRLVRVKGGNDYACVKHEWSKVQAI